MNGVTLSADVNTHQTQNQVEQQPSQWSLRDYLRVLFRQKAVFFTAFFAVMAIVVGSLVFHTPTYEASAKMLITGQKEIEAPYYKELSSQREIQASLTQSEIVTSDPILQRAVDALHLNQKPIDYERQFASPLKYWWIDLKKNAFLDKMNKLSPQQRDLFNYRRVVEELRKNIKVETVRDTDVFIIKVKDYDPIMAAVIANVVSRSYVIFDLEQQMAELQLKYGPKHPVIRQLADNIQSMINDLSGKPLTNTEAIGPASVKIVEQARVPLKPEGADKTLVLIIGFFMSIFLGIILAYIFEYMDQSVRNVRDVETALEASFLGSIPQSSMGNALIKGMRGSSKYLNAFANLADQIHLSVSVKGSKTFMVVSPERKDKSGFIAANLAVYLAEHASKKVLIIDANWRHPVMPKLFNLKPGAGLIDILTQRTDLNDVIKIIEPGLSVLPAGQSSLNPAPFINSDKMHLLLEELKVDFDVILIDCAELKAYQDAYLLGPLVDETIFVVSEGQTRRQVAARMLSGLRKSKTAIMGTVLNNRTYPIPRFIYENV